MVSVMKIAVLGSTGSIGGNALNVCREQGYSVDYLSCYKSVDKIVEQVNEFKPKVVAVEEESAYLQVKEALTNSSTQVVCRGGKEEIAKSGDYDILLNAVVGAAGVVSSYNTLKRGKRLALANKESLVVYGEELMKLCAESEAEIIPVDSEHSAIFQSLGFYNNSDIKKILLTASGGPFRDKSFDFIKTAKASSALKHPNWSMGQKISIDSATLMNKGLEIIEAMHLFDTTVSDIEVLVHRESILHSAVMFHDSSVIGQFGLPSMKLPIHYAFTYPNRINMGIERDLDLTDIAMLHFEKPDAEKFPCLNLAKYAGREGGLKPLILNTANEIAVAYYLEDKIGFYDISRVVEHALSNNFDFDYRVLSDVLSADRAVREFSKEYIEKEVLGV